MLCYNYSYRHLLSTFQQVNIIIWSYIPPNFSNSPWFWIRVNGSLKHNKLTYNIHIFLHPCYHRIENWMIKLKKTLILSEYLYKNIFLYDL